jgi:hypothetical protein
VTARAALAALLLAVLCPAAALAGDLSAEEQRWVKDLVAALGANSPRIRKGAEESLARMGPDALPAIADALPAVKGEAALKGLRRALEGMGRAEVTAVLGRLSQGASSRAAAKKFDDLAALLGGGAGASDGVVPAALALVPARLEEWALAPLAVERRIDGRLPPDLVQAVHVATVEAAGLRVDVDGDSTAETLLVPGAARVLEVGHGERKIPLLVYRKGGVWYACSASMLRGGGGSSVVEVLDADLDGRFDGPRDQVRVGDGAFGPAGESPTLALEDRIVAWRIVEDRGAPRMALTPEAAPAGLDPEAQSGLVAVNLRRRGVGLPPVRLDAARCEACRKHALYLQKNAGSPETAGLGAHQELEGKPGYTPEGATAGSSAVISGATEADAAVDDFAATMLHGKALWGTGAGGFGIGVSGGHGGGTVLWGDDPGPSTTGAPFVVPAPGQRRVSTRARPEIPEPDQPASWYASPRGFPISAFTAGLSLRQVRIRLYASDGKTPVVGRLWNDEAPIRAGHGGATFFMPAAPLDPRQTYVAAVVGTGERGEVSWTWSFRTD